MSIVNIKNKAYPIEMATINNSLFIGNNGKRYIKYGNDYSKSFLPKIFHRCGSKPNFNTTYVVEKEFDNVFIWTDHYGDKNICHWFHEFLLGIVFLKDLYIKYPNLKIIINKNARIKQNIKDVLFFIPNFKKESIYEFDLNNKCNAIKCNKIFVPLGNFTTYGNPNKIFNYFKNDLRINIISSENQNIYISRRKTKTNTRVLINVDEISEKIINKNFKEIYMEDLTMSEKINILQNSNKIIMELGAGCINLCFCKPNTTIYIMMQNNQRNNSFFSSMFSFLKNKFKIHFIYGIQTSNKTNGNPVNTPWKLDKNILEKYI